MNTIEDKIILVGITFVDAEQRLIEQYQTHGRIIKIENDMLVIQRNNLPDFYLPFNLDAMKPAPKGTFRERITGIEIENPDFIAQWTIDSTNIDKIEYYKNFGFNEFEKEIST